MSDQESNIRLEGIVLASRHDPDSTRFLGPVAIECSDATIWVLDYHQQSPFRVFAGRQVVAIGKPYQPKPPSSYVCGWPGKTPGQMIVPGHFRVSSMRLVEMASDAELAEVGAGSTLIGRYERNAGAGGKSVLSFVTDEGDVFVVANDPAGAKVGPVFDVWAYPVQPRASIERPPGPYLWISTARSCERTAPEANQEEPSAATRRQAALSRPLRPMSWIILAIGLALAIIGYYAGYYAGWIHPAY